MKALGGMSGYRIFGLGAAATCVLALLGGCGGGVENLNGSGGGITGGNTPGAGNTPVPTTGTGQVAIAPVAAALFTGLGAPPSCGGGSQSFVVTGNFPPFTVAPNDANAGCFDTTRLGASGDVFTFTAGRTAGTFSLTVTDVQRNTTTATVTLSNANAALLKVDLVPSQRSDNGNGTFTSVVGALVTDSLGVTASANIPVEFTLIDAVAGVSLTSPGYTDRPAPCTGSTAQPGTAASCITYAQSLQGTTVRIHARVQTANAGVLEDEATITLPDSRPPAPTPTPVPGQPAAIHLVTAAPTAISVHSFGVDQSTLTFQVTDALGTPLSGVTVIFTLNEGGDASLSPQQGTSDANGNVVVTLTSGMQAGSPQIIAQAQGGPGARVQSSAVTIFGGAPTQDGLTIGPKVLNIAGRVQFGLQDTISVYANDRFTNAVPPGVQFSFYTNGPSVVAPTSTNLFGIATGILQTEANIPPNGIVTVLACTTGEESFRDINGNGMFDAGIDQLTGDNQPEPFIDWRPFPDLPEFKGFPNDSDCIPRAQHCTKDGDCGPTGKCDPDLLFCVGQEPPWLCNNAFDPDVPSERFAKDLNGNGVWDTQGTPGQWDNNIQVCVSVPITFSGGLVPPVASPQELRVFEGGSQTFTVEVHDDLLNPLVGGSTLSFTSTSPKVRIDPASITIGDGESFNEIVDGLTRFTFTVSDAADDPIPMESPASIILTVVSQNGGGPYTLVSGSVDIPRSTATPTVTGTPTPTPDLPTVDPNQVALPAGTGTDPNCNGGAQQIVVRGGSPPFTVSPGGGCVDFTTVPMSGKAFTFTAGPVPGNYSITVQDALGRTTKVGVTIQGPATSTPTITVPPTATATATFTLAPTVTPSPTPAAAHIQIALFTNQASQNGDNSFSSVLSALVTDAHGVVVPNGFEVQFSIIDPTPIPDGVSVFSPVFTGQAVPCTVSFPVVASPGNALTCIKYNQQQAGSTITVLAVVQTPTGPLSDQQIITLPDLRPTPTATFAPTATPPLTPISLAAAMQFVSAVPTPIGVRQSGLPEQSTLTFLVTDANQNPLGNIPVTFTLSGIGDETISPLHATSDSTGLVRTTLSSGIRASTVRVVASVDAAPTIHVQSTAVSVFGAPPAQNRFSMGPDKLNIPGRVRNGLQDVMTAYVNDRFGNAVPPGTAVSFVSNGSSVVTQTTTGDNGEATAVLIAEEVIPPTGIVTVLAYTRGEEQFLDNNGNGIFDARCVDGVTCTNDMDCLLHGASECVARCPDLTECPSSGDCTGHGGGTCDVPSQADLPEPFIDFRPLPTFLAPVPPNDADCPIPAGTDLATPLCNDRFDPNKPFELFVDLPPKNGIWDITPPDNHWDNNIVLFEAATVTFSGHTQVPVVTNVTDPANPIPCTLPNGQLAPSCFAIPNGGSATFTVEVHDDLYNPLVAGSTVNITAEATQVILGQITLLDGQSFNQLVDGLTRFTFILKDPDPKDTDPPVATFIDVKITSPNDSGEFLVGQGTVD